MALDEMTAVLEAAKRGERIEARKKDTDYPWVLTESPVWDFFECEYRVYKPEPKKVKSYAWTCTSKDGKTAFLRYIDGQDNLYPEYGWKRAPQFDIEWGSDNDQGKPRAKAGEARCSESV